MYLPGGNAGAPVTELIASPLPIRDLPILLAPAAVAVDKKKRGVFLPFEIGTDLRDDTEVEYTALTLDPAGRVAGRTSGRGRAKDGRLVGDIALPAEAKTYQVRFAAHAVNPEVTGLAFATMKVPEGNYRITVTLGDVITIAVVGCLIIATLVVCGRALFAVVLDEEASRVAGLPIGILNDVFAVLTAVTVVASMRIVGILLVSALMVLPVGAGQAISRSFRGLLLVSSAIGVFCVIAGLAAARLLDLRPGGSIVLLAAAAYGLAAVFSPVWRSTLAAHSTVG